MEPVNIDWDSLNISKKDQKSIKKISKTGTEYRVELKYGYISLLGQSVIVTSSQTELKKELKRVEAGLTNEEIKKLPKTADWEKELDNYFYSWVTNAQQFYEQDFSKLLTVIDTESREIWEKKLKIKYEKYLASGKASYNYPGFEQYTPYKLYYRSEQGIKPELMSLYRTESKDRLNKLNSINEKNKNKFLKAVEQIGGKRIKIKYVYYTEDETMHGIYLCKSKEVFFSLAYKKGFNLIKDGLKYIVK